ncbi:MAG: glycoside hydrolase family 3 C-terminal domain-containing protein [Anaerolineae bacterium]|nr:glycoside hydrolase family 3 C-terminal domain-containing protein [Anaerolineae bacterium]
MDMQELVQKLTLEEKAALCTGLTAWLTVPVERLNIPSIWVSDGPHGVRRAEQWGEAKPATCFPTASALASTWDRDLIAELGEALADECIALGVSVVLGPGNNMKRSPLCGRNFEYFSEDPFLGGEMAATYINAVQGKGIGTSLKHYVANNQEFERMSMDAQVDERALREIYLAGFERAVKNAQPWTVMCSYNLINGVYGSENKRTLTEILKDEWGFEGFVVSDWGAVHDRVASLQGGLDLEMPGPRHERTQKVIDAVKAGELDEALLDEAVRRILRIVFMAQETPKGDPEVGVSAEMFAKHHALARRISGESIVLLKNEGDLLPLKDVKSLAVIGVTAKEPRYQGGGSSHINPPQVDVPFDELAKLAGDATLTYAPGYTMEPGFDQSLIDDAVKVAAAAEIALLYMGLPDWKETEGLDRPDTDLTEQQIALIKAVAAQAPKTVVILNSGSAVTMGDWGADVDAVLEAWLMGQAGGGAIADVLFGVVNPAGRLAETFPLRLQDTPAYLNFPGENGVVRYGESIFIGYRYYDAREMDVQFPFGYGLSYTTFAYDNLQLSTDAISDGDDLTVSVDVTNTGSVAGKTVVQVYVRDPEARLVRPPKELKGFAKVALETGETKTVTITLEPRAFQYYDPLYEMWIAESGTFEILAGGSSADLPLSASVELTSTQKLPCKLHRTSPISHWMQDPRGKPMVEALMAQMMANLPGMDGESDIWLGMELMPLRVVLGFFGGEGALGKSPDVIIDEMLAQAYKED